MSTALAFRQRLHRSTQRLGGEASNVKVRKPASRVHDPVTGTVTEGDPVDTAVVAAVTDYLDRDVDGSLIRASDKKVHISAHSVATAGLTLTEDDALLVGGVAHEIVHLEVVAPSGTVEGYIAQVRK